MLVLLWLACTNDDTTPTASEVPTTGTGATTSDTTPTDTDTSDPSEPPTIPAACQPLPAPTGTVVDVDPSQDGDLADMLANAAPDTTFRLATGTYIIAGSQLVASVPGTTIRSASGVPTDVVLEGAFGVTSAIQIAAPFVTVAELTLRSAAVHLVHVDANSGATTDTLLHGLYLEDFGRGAIAVEAGDTWSDMGTISCNQIVLTGDGRDRAAACGLAGITIDGGWGWTVRDNTIEGLWCSKGPAAGPALHVFGGARDIDVVRNRIWDSTLGIQYGEGAAGGRTYDDAPCAGAAAQTFGGRVVNNMVAADGSEILDSDHGILTGIAVESACEALVAHNSVHSGVLPSSGSIDHRFAMTTGRLTNNLASHGILRSEGSLIVAAGNIENAPVSSWLLPRVGDLHLVASAQEAINTGVTDVAADVLDDLDLELRDDRPDVGADEL